MSNDINKLILDITDDDYEIIDKSLWDKLDYNDSIYIEKLDNTINKYYFKSINDKYLFCSNSKYNSNSKNFKCIIFKFLLININKLYRQSKINNNIDMMLLNKKIETLANIINNLVIIINKKK